MMRAWLIGSLLVVLVLVVCLFGFAPLPAQDSDGKSGGEEEATGETPEAPGEGARKDGDPVTRKTPASNHWARAALTANRVNTRARRREGGSGTDKPARSALAWLIRHQHPDGRWSPTHFKQRCKKPEKKPCKSKVPAYTDGTGFPGYDVGVTGLALLAFTGAGYTHVEADRKGFAGAIENAVRWLLAKQERSEDPKLDGTVGLSDAEGHVYNHAIATLALAELLIGSGDRELLGKPVERALQHCLLAQNEGYGWRYDVAGGANDSSVTGWMAQALHVGRACSVAGLIELPAEDFDVPLQSALKWIERATSKGGTTGYQSPGDPGSVIRGVYPTPYPFDKGKLSTCTGISLLLRRLGGEPADSAVVRAQVLLLSQHPPFWQPASKVRKSTINLYYWYYTSHGMFQAGGSDWKAWSKALKRALRKHQRDGGCEEGSWDPIGEWGAAGGRVYSTAMGAITLQVYQRYERVPDSE